MSKQSATLGTLLRQLIDLTDGAVEANYASLSLDYRPRFTPVVKLLASRGPCTIRQLSQEASVSHSAASQTVAEMVRKGLVRLERGETDGRERMVRLTSLTEAMLPTLQRCWAAHNAAADSLSADLGWDLAEGLARAVTLLEERTFAERISEHIGDLKHSLPADHDRSGLEQH